MFMPLMIFCWPLVYQTYRGQSVRHVTAKGPLPTPPVSTSSSISVLVTAGMELLLLGLGYRRGLECGYQSWRSGSAAPETVSHPVNIYSTASHLRARLHLWTYQLQLDMCHWLTSDK